MESSPNEQSIGMGLAGICFPPEQAQGRRFSEPAGFYRSTAKSHRGSWVRSSAAEHLYPSDWLPALPSIRLGTGEAPKPLPCLLRKKGGVLPLHPSSADEGISPRHLIIETDDRKKR